jgi:hypothetical protein
MLIAHHRDHLRGVLQRRLSQASAIVVFDSLAPGA